MATYKVTGQVTLYIETEFEDDGILDLQDQAFKALQDDAIDKFGSYSLDGDFEVEGVSVIEEPR